MKSTTRFFTFIFITVIYFHAGAVHSQGTWSQKADFGGPARDGAAGFSIGAKGYIGIGTDGGSFFKDLWEWDKVTDAWTQKANFGGTPRVGAVAFSIGTKGYLGTGGLTSTGPFYADFWEWDQSTNVWTQKANFGGTTRWEAIGFSIGTKGYIGTGYDGTSDKQDFWEWDQSTNVWTQKTNFGGVARANAVAFSIGADGYVGTGINGSTALFDFWKFDPILNTWTQKSNFPGLARYNASAFSIGSKGYLGTGNNGVAVYQDFWEYAPTPNSWSQVGSMVGVARNSAVAFSIGFKGYVGGGLDASSGRVNDYWAFSPACNLSPVVSTTNSSCGQPTGTASVVVTGGTPPYVYQWTNGDNTSKADSMGSGLYMVIVTDSIGCSQSTPTMISDVGAPNIVLLGKTNVTCNGLSNGSINIGVSGGSSPYTYKWVNGATTQDVSNLSAGPYQVEVTGSNGCMAMDNIVITQPAVVTASVVITNATCGSPNGSAHVFPSGGSAPYTYLWSTTPAQTSSTATGLSAGGYAVVVTDLNGCTGIAPAPIVNVGGAVVAVDSVKAADCSTKTGSIYVSITGGSAPYTFTWFDANYNLVAATEDLVGVAAGPYFLVVHSNGNPCDGVYMGMLPKQIPVAPPICIVTVDSITGKNVCVFQKDSLLNAGLSSYNFYRETVVTGQYQLLGSRPATLTSAWTDQSANPLQRAWRYKISSVDTCGNESLISASHKTIHLSANIGINNTVNLAWDDYEGFSFGTFIIYRSNAAGGWDSLDAVSGTNHSYTDLNPPVPLVNVSYYVAVRHPGPCTISIKNPQPMTSNLNLSKSNINKIINPSGVAYYPELASFIHVYPNPTTGAFVIRNEKNIIKNAEVYNVFGELVYHAAVNSKEESVSLNLPAGIYFMKVKTEEGTVTKKIVVNK